MKLHGYAANMALANALPGSEVLNGLLSERIGFLFNEIDLAKVDAEVAVEAKPYTNMSDVKINLGSLFVKLLELAKTSTVNPKFLKILTLSILKTKGNLATQALKFYLESCL